jgi:prepilin-type N-terminal cleavage/methylation domain-containing protein
MGCVTMRRRRGFSLIELVTVIVILSVMALAAAGPALSSMDSLRTRAAAARMAADIRYARRFALASGLKTWVVFDAAENSYQLHVEDRDNPGKAGRLPLTRPLDQSTDTVQFGTGPFANVSITGVSIGSGSEIEFSSFGEPFDGGGTSLSATGTVALSNGVVVTIHPAGGAVERSG